MNKKDVLFGFLLYNTQVLGFGVKSHSLFLTVALKLVFSPYCNVKNKGPSTFLFRLSVCGDWFGGLGLFVCSEDCTYGLLHARQAFC